MNPADGERAAELLEDVAVGDRSPNDPEVVAFAERDPDFELELARLRRTIARLTEAAELERAVLADWAEASGPVPGEEAALGKLRELIETTPVPAQEAATVGGPRRRSPLRLLIPLAAAAAIVFVVWLFQRQTSEAPERLDDPSELILGADQIRPLAPRGRVERFHTFHWEADLRPGERFELRILDPEDPGEPLFVTATRESRWVAPEDVAAEWPDEIVWEVSLISVLNEIERSSVRVTASR